MNLVIVGGGSSAFQITKNLRSSGFDGRINIISNENFLPYNRLLLPRLLREDIPLEKVFFEEKDFYVKNNVNIYFGYQVATSDGQIEVKKQNKKASFGELKELFKESHNSLEEITSLINDAHLVVWAISGDAFRPGHFTDENSLVWRDLIDTFTIKQTLVEASLNNQRICLIGGSFISLELAVACKHYGVDFDWGIKTKTFLKEGIDQKLNSHILEICKNHGINNIFLNQSVENITFKDGFYHFNLSGQVRQVSKFLVGAGVNRNKDLSKNDSLVITNKQIVAGDLISFISKSGERIFAGSFNQSQKSSKLVSEYILSLNNENHTNIKKDLIPSLNSLGGVMYQIKLFDKAIRMSGSLTGDFEVVETDKDLTQIWSLNGEEVGKITIQK